MKVKLGGYIQEYSLRNKANEDIPVYSVTNTQGFCQDYFGKEVASKDKSTYKIVPRGYFAYNPSRINVGSVDWQRDEDQVIVSPLYNVFSVSPELNQQYLYYYLKSDFALHRIKAVATGSVRDNLKLEMLKNFPIRIPSVEEQEYIVQALDKAKNIIDLRRNELQKFDDLIRARFVEMFGDPAGKMNNYPKKRFDELCENLDSKRKPITASVRESGNYPYYGASGIVDYVADYIFDEDILLVSEDGANLLMRSTPIAFSVSGKVWVNNHAHVVRFKNIYMQKYIEVYFSMIDISDQITGSAQPKLNQAKLNALEFALPEDALLLEYYDFVAQIDKSKATVQKALDETQLLFDSLMQQYFG